MLTIVAMDTSLNLVVKNAEIKAGVKNILAQRGNKLYNTDGTFVESIGKAKRNPLTEAQLKVIQELLPEADKAVDTLIAQVKERQQPKVEPIPQPKQEVGILEKALLETLSQVGAGSIVEAIKPKIDAFIKEEYGIKPQRIEVVTEFGKKEQDGVFHDKFEDVLTCVASDIPVLLTGPAGTGKNYLVKQVADALDLTFYFTNAVTQEYKLTGFIDAHGNFHETEFYKAFKNGGLFMLDEIDASIPEVLVILNAAIANRYFDFPNGRIDAHDNFRIIAAGNTYGTGADEEYVGRYQLDSASLDRFASETIDYCENIEMSIANDDKELVTFIHDIRQALLDCGIKHVVSYRGTSMVAKLTQTKMPLTKILRMSICKGLGIDDLTQIKASMKKDTRYHRALGELIA